MITNGVAARIKTIVKERGYKIGDFLRDCGMGVNALSQMAKAQDISASTLLVVADRLSCSVDFLLGRTDVVAVGAMPEGAVVLSDDELLLLERYRSLSDDGREVVRSEALRQRQLQNLNRGTGEGEANAG